MTSVAGTGGRGGRVQTTLSVTPGQTLYLYVGGAGTGCNTGGWNGGGLTSCTYSGSSNQGAGGGAHLGGGAGIGFGIEADQPGAPRRQQLQRRDQAGGAIGPDAAAHLNARQRHRCPASTDSGEGFFPAFADQQL